MTSVPVPRSTAACALAMLLLSACSRSDDESERIARVEGAEHAELVRRTTSTLGLFGPPTPLVDWVLRVPGTPPIEVVNPCDAPVRLFVSVAPSRDRIILRCRPDARPILVYFDAGSTVAVWHDPDVGGIGPRHVRWSEIPSLVGAAPELALANAGDPAMLFPLVRARAGDAALEDALAATIDLRFGAAGPSERDAWIVAFRTLPQARRDVLSARLREIVVARETSAPVLLRASLVVTKDDPTTERMLAERALRFVAPWTYENRNAATTRDIVVHRLLGSAPLEAARVGCAQLAVQPNEPWATVAVALADAPCDALEHAVDEVLDVIPLSTNLGLAESHDAVLAGDDTALLARLAAVASTPYPDLPLGRPTEPELALYVAARRHDAMPPALALRFARLRYPAEDGDVARCEDVDVGTRCRCHDLELRRFHLLSAVPSDAREGRADPCTFRIDDSRRMLVDVRAAPR